jgi:WD40 repeat protein
VGQSCRRLAMLVGASVLALISRPATCPAEPPPASPTPDRAAVEQMVRERLGKSQGGTPRIAQGGIEVVLQTGHAAEITKVAFSPDGRYILSGSFDESVKLWDVASGQDVRTLHGFSFGPAWVGFTADSARFLVLDETALAVYDTGTGQLLNRLPEAGYTLSPIVSADGRIAISSHPGKASVSVVELATGNTLWTVPVDTSESVVALSADGSTLLTARRLVKMSSMSALKAALTPSRAELKATARVELHVWDVANRRGPRSVPITPGSQNDSMVDNFALSPDGHRLLEELPDHTLAVYELENGQRIQTFSGRWSLQSRTATALMFSPDGRIVARSTYDGVQLWELATGRTLATLEGAAVNFSADGQRLVIGKAAGGVPLLHDLATGRDTPLGGGTAGVSDLALTPDERYVVAAMEDGTARLWDLSTGQVVRGFECPGKGGVSSVSTGARNGVVATGCSDGSAWLWELSSGRRLREISPPSADGELARMVVRFGADEAVLAVGSRQQLTLWDVAAARAIASVTLPRTPDPPGAQDFFKQMGIVMPKVTVVRPAQSANPELASVAERSHWIRCLAVRPRDNAVAVGTDVDVSLWDVSDGKLIRRLGGSTTAAALPATPRGESTSNERPAEKRSGGSMLGRVFGGLPAGGSRGDMPATASMGSMDMGQMMRAMQIAQSGEGARTLAFNADGTSLLTLGNTGKHVWDVATGEEIHIRTAQGSAPAANDPAALIDAVLPTSITPGGTGAVAFSPDGRFVAYGVGHVIRLWDLASGRDTLELFGHSSDVTSVVFVPHRPVLVSGSRDGSVRVWDLQSGRESAALIALGQADSVAVTPDGYYRASKSSLKGVAFRVRGELYPFEQFDLRFNRPDIVLERLGLAAPDTVQTYRNAYQRRFKKTGFTESMLGGEFHAPEVELTSDIPTTTSETTLAFRIRASDSKYALDRINVFVNDVPVYGTAGLAATDHTAHSLERELRTPLVPGRNKVQVAAVNQQGAESLRRTFYTNADGSFPAADVYVVAIGVSEYKNPAYNLRFAAKDAGDLAGLYKALETRPGAQGHVHTLMLTDSRATRTQIQQAKRWLQQSQPHDLVVVFAAGHGITDAESNYYFGTYDIDPAHPAVNGLPYEEFEGLLDGIPALQKVLLLDTCFSGEIDKDVGVAVAGADTGGAGTVTMRAFKPIRGVTITADSATTAVQGPRLSSAMLRFQQDWFADLRRGTGAVVISSSSGDEFSLEGEQWHNGVFTYTLLQGLKNSEAAPNKDHSVTVSELQAYVIEQVRKLTNGGQNPTVRRENLDYDFPVYY